ncbi:MAG: amino acid adenylation domain-containing protein [Acidobacteriota bacterium]
MRDTLPPEAARTPNPCIHQCFEAQAERTPDAIAVVAGEDRLTYGDLNARANRLAHHLRTRGVGPETPVGVCLERSATLIVALLAVLKAGGAYVPLDPAYPAERLAFMLRDSLVPVLLTEQRMLGMLADVSAEIICLDDCPEIVLARSDNPSSGATPANLAYVIYTSGSTGRPKGVEVIHQTVVHLFAATREPLKVREGDVWTVVHSSGFDFSVWEIWGSLLQGGTLIVVSLSIVQSPRALYDLLRLERVTVLNQTPSALRALLDARRQAAAAGEADWSLRLIVCGGDALDHELAAELSRLTIPVWNFYGPTESSVWTTCTLIKDAGVDRAPSIGPPIADLEVYLVDEQQQLVPSGTPGELLIGGAGLARGYRGRPELTAERFIPHPFSHDAGARLYRTGDSGRNLPDGSIEFLGRIDHQVKIRGYRIEPGEIETVLLQHPAVRECVVVARDDRTGAQRLVAYVVRDTDAASGEASARLLAQWRAVYDNTYHRAGAETPSDPTFNPAGWNSSYTGQPMPAVEVREWVDDTVNRILALHPRRVLEIGCGAGLLLYRIAPQCAAYQATDFSVTAIDLLTAQLRASPGEFGHVSLSHREAIDFSGFDAGLFDVVVINSVAQYFPNAAYLRRVLDGAVRVTRAGGSVFVGDVRSLPLLEALTASVQLDQAPPSLSLDELRRRVSTAIAAEDELVVDPRFFTSVAQEFSQHCAVRVMPKRGRNRNELTRFRYDVMLRVLPSPASAPPVERREWIGDELTLDRVRSLLETQRPEVLAVSGIPNARVRADANLVDLLAGGNPDGTVADLRAALDLLPAAGVEPDDLWSIEQSGRYAVDLSWAESGPDGSYDAVFRRADVAAEAAAPAFQSREYVDTTKHWNAYANTPSARVSTSILVPELIEFLEGKLPGQMVPSVFVFLDALPLTPNRKVDRKALPPPGNTRPTLAQPFVAPCTDAETLLAGIWADVLGLDRVGVHDNFFQLGGHSLLAIQVASRVRDAVEAEMSLGTFFETPTIAGLARQLASAGASRARRPAITAVAKGASAPLSFGQARIWFLSELVPDTPAYHIPLAVPFDRSPDLEVLERALNEIVRRHDVLRMTVADLNGTPSQVTAERLILRLPLDDLTELPLDRRLAETERIIAREAEAPFDLANGPLVRARLLRSSAAEHVLLISMHHLVGDGWSIGVLLKELGALYEAFAAGRPSPLTELPIQYADYALWQRSAARAGVLEEELRYWTNELEGAIHTLDLPADRPRPRAQTFRGARAVLPLTPRLSRAVKAFSQREGVTPFMTLLASFSALLHRYTGQDDIVVGSPVVNRPDTDTEALIGLFLNNVVLRARFPSDLPFRALLLQVRDAALGAHAHQELPFEMLVESLNPQRDSSRTPLFQVFFNFFSFADERVRLPGLASQPVSPAATWSQPAAAWSQFDLTFYVAEIEDRYQLIVVYSSDLFEHTRIESLLRQFRLLLEQAVSAPDQLVTAYSLRDPESAALLPHPGLSLPEPGHEPVATQFFAIAAAMPDRLAVGSGSGSWTYRDLAAHADRIARQLLADGLLKGDAVALSGPPSPEGIAGMLGVLAAGGVLLLLDEHLPVERRRLMIGEAGAERLLHCGEWTTADDWIRQDPALAVTQVVDAAGTRMERNGADAADRLDLPAIAPDDPAYLFFTSGTTGVPKGVLGRHKGLSHFLDWQRAAFGIGPDDRSAQLTGLSFDVVLRDIFLPLTTGASVHLPDDSSGLSSGRTVAWLDRQRISILHTVPSIAQNWLSDLPAGASLHSLRWVFFAGEPLTDALVQRWRGAFPDSGRVVNLYGPTETTLAKCCYVVPENPPAGVQPVGWPLPETQALVLNRGGDLCGIAEPGEIAIRTPFRTLGYVNGGAEDRDRFVRNRFTDDPNDLIYRTGDRGRYRPDGALEILGRLDDQTKIRGVRVEPAEVSAVLARHPAVAACVVTSVKDVEGANALAAYVVASRQTPIAVSELRVYLEAALPAAMVPGYFVVIDALPLTPNGKVDRRRLPGPRESDRATDGVYVAPRNPTERVIAEIWSDVLGVERPGVFDGFFELGGHSLKATRVVSRINAAFQIALPLRTLFEAATIAGVAAVVEDRLIDELELIPGDELDERLQ